MTDKDYPCPACGSRDTVRGLLSGGHWGTFQPDGLRFWSLTTPMLPLRERAKPTGARGTRRGHACTACGLVWAYVDAARLRKTLREGGNAATRARFAGSDKSARTR